MIKRAFQFAAAMFLLVFSCTPADRQTMVKVVEVSAPACEQIAKEFGREDIAQACATSGDLLPILARLLAESQQAAHQIRIMSSECSIPQRDSIDGGADVGDGGQLDERK